MEHIKNEISVLYDTASDIYKSLTNSILERLEIILNSIPENEISFHSVDGPCILNYYLRDGRYGSDEVERIFYKSNKVLIDIPNKKPMNVKDLDLDNQIILLYFILNINETI